MRRFCVFAIVMLLAMPGFLTAAEGDAAKAVASTLSAKSGGDVLDGVQEAGKKNVDGNYQIKQGDKVNIKIFPEDQFIRGGQYEVTPEGNVTLPLLGKVEIAGKTINEAAEDLRKIIDKDYIISPEVVIEILGYKLETFVILGQIQKPGTFSIPAGPQDFSFLQAISMAGGFSQIANIKKIKIIRQNEGQRKIIRVNAENIISGDAEDIKIEAGDVIHVSESIF